MKAKRNEKDEEKEKDKRDNRTQEKVQIRTSGLHVSRMSLTSAFTIVELLIVIVVIAILAVVTIVSYNGISSRAKDASLASEAAQIGKIIQMNQTTNSSGLPATDNPVTSRQDVLTNIGITSFSSKLCVGYEYASGNVGDSNSNHSEYYDTCNPDLIEGQVPIFDKSKIYVSYYRGVNTDWNGSVSIIDSVYASVEYSYWSNSQNSWIYNNTDEAYLQANGGSGALRCDPFGIYRYYYDASCKWPGFPK